MTPLEIEETEKYFSKYSDSDYNDCTIRNEPIQGKYTHKEWDLFGIVIFADRGVYQTNTDHEIQEIGRAHV